MSDSSLAEEDGSSSKDQGEEGLGGRSEERTVEVEGKGEEKEEGQVQAFEEEETEEKEEKERTGPGSLSLTPDIVKGRGDEEEEASPRTPGIATTSRLPDMLDHTPHSFGESDR